MRRLRRLRRLGRLSGGCGGCDRYRRYEGCGCGCGCVTPAEPDGGCGGSRGCALAVELRRLQTRRGERLRGCWRHYTSRTLVVWAESLMLQMGCSVFRRAPACSGRARTQRMVYLSSCLVYPHMLSLHKHFNGNVFGFQPSQLVAVGYPPFKSKFD